MPAPRFTALSSKSSGSRPFKPRDAGAIPVEAAIFPARGCGPFIFEAVPVLDPRPEPTGPYRISREPAGGQSRQGLISDTVNLGRRRRSRPRGFPLCRHAVQVPGLSRLRTQAQCPPGNNFRRRLFTRGRLRTTHRVRFRPQLADDKHEVGSAACRPISMRAWCKSNMRPRQG